MPDYVATIGNNPANLVFSNTFVKLLPYLEQQALYDKALAHGFAALNGPTVSIYVSPLDATAGNPAGWSSYAVNWNAVGQEGLSLGKSFTDGTGSTILFTERYMACGNPVVYNAWPARVAGQAVNGIAATQPATLTSDAPPQFAPTVASCASDGASTPDSSAILTAMADGSVRNVSLGQATGAVASPPGVTNWQAALTLRQGEILGPGW
jgi:hypothetical protein